MSDDEEFKRLLLGMPEFFCALCAGKSCMGYQFVIVGDQCELVYHLCWTCRTKMESPPPPALVFRKESSLAELRMYMFDARGVTATDSKVYTVVTD